jgi:hypothetical protein
MRLGRLQEFSVRQYAAAFDAQLKVVAAAHHGKAAHFARNLGTRADGCGDAGRAVFKRIRGCRLNAILLVVQAGFQPSVGLPCVQ